MNQFALIENDRASGIPLRVMVIGLILVVVNAYWISVNDLVRGLSHNYMSLFSNAVFTFFVVILFNLLLKKLAPNLALRDSDLLVIYVMVVIVTTMSGKRTNRLISILSHPFWFATPENDWRDLFWRHIPPWFTVKDEDVLGGFFLGETSFFAQTYISAWVGPLFYWSAFTFVLCFVLFCINTIIRKQFTEHERLTYPITWLPLEIGRDTSAFLKNKLMWVGFGIAAGVSLLNGLNVFYPVFPSIPVGWTRIDFPDKPWSYMGGTLVSFQLFFIGLSYFMPLDLAFSAWFFYLLQKMIRMLTGMMGWRDLYFHEQAQGAWIGLGFLALWVARRHLKRVFIQATTGKGMIDDAQEPMRYRTALWGITAGLVFLLWFSYKAGLSFWVLLLFFGIYCCSAIGLTKVRAGLGLGFHEILQLDPGRTMVTATGTRVYGSRNLTVLTFFYWLNRDQPNHPMPNQLEAFRIGEQANINNRRLLWAMLITLVVGIPVSFLIYLSLLYNLGADNTGPWIIGIGREGFARRLQMWLSNPLGRDYVTMGFMGYGFCVTGFLLAMKVRFLWWPFHPVGYVLAISPGEMVYIWCPLLISWAIKLAILRYGGLQAYRRAIPFFAGLIMGDYTMGGIWSVISAVFKITTYHMGWHPQLPQ